jgi:hypothetical protein
MSNYLVMRLAVIFALGVFSPANACDTITDKDRVKLVS